jgi:hypothetical protein
MSMTASASAMVSAVKVVLALAAVAACCVPMLTGPAAADGAYQDAGELRLVRQIEVSVDAEPNGNCLSQPASLKADAELVLRRSKIVVVNKGSSEKGSYLLTLIVDGFEISEQQPEMCVITIEIQLTRFALMPEGHYSAVLAYVGGGQMFWEKADVMDRLRSRVSNVATDLANEILKAQGQ